MMNKPAKEFRDGLAIEGLLFLARDEERKRIARDLHDSTGQLLTSLRLSLARLKEHVSAEFIDIADECDVALDQLFAEVRTFSFLGHPPALDQHDLGEALELLLAGFEDRAKISIERKLMLSRSLPEPVETCIYRMVQEGLLNVHRHTSATAMDVAVVDSGRRVDVRLSDNGCNETADHWVSGVGLSSMAERTEELGGTLKISRSSTGTMLLASLPLNSRSSRHSDKN